MLEKALLLPVVAYLGVPSVLEIGVKSIIPPSAWQTQVSPLPEAGGHLSPLGPSATELSKKLCRQNKIPTIGPIIYKGVGLASVTNKPRPQIEVQVRSSDICWYDKEMRHIELPTQT